MKFALIRQGAGEEDGDSDSDHSDVDLGKGISNSRVSAHPYMKRWLVSFVDEVVANLEMSSWIG